MRSSDLLMVRVRYGSIRKKLRLRAETTAVTSPAVRPPSSATTMVKIRKTKARLEAAVSVRNGINRMPRAMAPMPPRATSIWESSRAMASPHSAWSR